MENPMNVEELGVPLVKLPYPHLCRPKTLGLGPSSELRAARRARRSASLRPTRPAGRLRARHGAPRKGRGRGAEGGDATGGQAGDAAPWGCESQENSDFRILNR